jgi:hypothetical protein
MADNFPNQLSTSIKDYKLRNCFLAYECDADWSALEKTKKEKIRFCTKCNDEVHQCDTDQELAIAIRENFCIAITSPCKEDHPAVVLVGSLRARKEF